MTKANKSLYTLLILATAISGAFAISSKAQLASLSQAKKDFIPDRCVLYDKNPICEEDSGDLMISSGNYPACVCFSDGTCEFRSDKSRCQWCYHEGAVSVNEGQKCPDLNGGLLHVCPQRYIVLLDPPVLDGPGSGYYVPPVYAPPPQPVFYEPEAPVLIADPPVETIDLVPTTVSETVPESDYPILLSDPIVLTASADSLAKSSQQNLIAKPLPIRLPPIKVKPTKGCICTDDGVCTKAKSSDWNSECDDGRVVAVVENGSCPKSAPCKLKAPEGAYKCTKSDRKSQRMCPMYISLYGCVCYKDGTCVNQGTNSCSACQNSDIVSVSTSSCNCV